VLLIARRYKAAEVAARQQLKQDSGKELEKEEAEDWGEIGLLKLTTTTHSNCR